MAANIGHGVIVMFAEPVLNTRVVHASMKKASSGSTPDHGRKMYTLEIVGAFLGEALMNGFSRHTTSVVPLRIADSDYRPPPSMRMRFHRVVGRAYR